MKKILVLAVITVLGFTNANAQKIKFGAKAGINITNITGNNTSSLEAVSAFNFGLVTEIPIAKKFSFQPELMFSGQGYSFEGRDGNLVSLSYLNVPLMAKYYVTKGLSLEAGPQIGYLLSAKNASTNVKDAFKKVDFAANLGIGYKLENGLNFGARYNFGLSNINNVSGDSNKFRNTVFQISVGYFFF
jgi:hypothetical protein